MPETYYNIPGGLEDENGQSIPEGHRLYDVAMEKVGNGDAVILDKPEPTANNETIRDQALGAMAYDLDNDTIVDARTLTDTSGRIIQVRPKDEQRITAGIRGIGLASLSTIDWRMLDNVARPVSATELQTAWDAGTLRAMQIWSDYNNG